MTLPEARVVWRRSPSPSALLGEDESRPEPKLPSPLAAPSPPPLPTLLSPLPGLPSSVSQPTQSPRLLAARPVRRPTRRIRRYRRPDRVVLPGTDARPVAPVPPLAQPAAPPLRPPPPAEHLPQSSLFLPRMVQASSCSRAHARGHVSQQSQAAVPAAKRARRDRGSSRSPPRLQSPLKHDMSRGFARPLPRSPSLTAESTVEPMPGMASQPQPAPALAPAPKDTASFIAYVNAHLFDGLEPDPTPAAPRGGITRCTTDPSLRFTSPSRPEDVCSPVRRGTPPSSARTEPRASSVPTSPLPVESQWKPRKPAVTSPAKPLAALSSPAKGTCLSPLQARALSSPVNPLRMRRAGTSLRTTSPNPWSGPSPAQSSALEGAMWVPLKREPSPPPRPVKGMRPGQLVGPGSSPGTAIVLSDEEDIEMVGILLPEAQTKQFNGHVDSPSSQDI